MVVLSQHPTSGCPLQVRIQLRSATEPQMVEKEKIDPSSHKIWWLYRTGHNAHFLGKLLLGLSSSAIFHTTSLSSTELSTEAVELNNISALCRGQTCVKGFRAAIELWIQSLQPRQSLSSRILHQPGSQAKEAVNDSWSSRNRGAWRFGGNAFPMAGSARERCDLEAMLFFLLRRFLG